MPKKVGSITLEYDRGDGVIESQAFDAEFHNALITGDVSALEGTFVGKLDANAVDAVSRLNIAGRAVAITKTGKRGSSDDPPRIGFDDDGVYRSLIDIALEVPLGSSSGVFVAANLSYQCVDTKGDENSMFPCQYRILVDGAAYFTSAVEVWGNWFMNFDYHIHEMLLYLSAGQTHTISLQYRWFDRPTNVYPLFRNITYRADIMRK
ncbi:MAG: hypothetical protein RR740_00150 [Pseudomonas sp.]